MPTSHNEPPASGLQFPVSCFGFWMLAAGCRLLVFPGSAPVLNGFQHTVFSNQLGREVSRFESCPFKTRNTKPETPSCADCRMLETHVNRSPVDSRFKSWRRRFSLRSNRLAKRRVVRKARSASVASAADLPLRKLQDWKLKTGC